MLGFYLAESGCPLPATVTRLLSSLIHLCSSPQSCGWLVGWVVGRLSGGKDRVSLFARAVYHQGSQKRTILELGPDAERGGYEPAGLQGRGRGCGGAEGPEPGPESGVCGAHSTSTPSSFTATTRATRIPETKAHLPHPAGSRESHRPHPWIH